MLIATNNTNTPFSSLNTLLLIYLITLYKPPNTLKPITNTHLSTIYIQETKRNTTIHTP